MTLGHGGLVHCDVPAMNNRTLGARCTSCKRAINCKMVRPGLRVYGVICRHECTAVHPSVEPRLLAYQGVYPAVYVFIGSICYLVSFLVSLWKLLFIIDQIHPE